MYREVKKYQILWSCRVGLFFINPMNLFLARVLMIFIISNFYYESSITYCTFADSHQQKVEAHQWHALERYLKEGYGVKNIPLKIQLQFGTLKVDCFENEKYYPDLIEHLFINSDYFHKVHFLSRCTDKKTDAFFDALEGFVNGQQGTSWKFHSIFFVYFIDEVGLKSPTVIFLTHAWVKSF